jgi:hypothetical protein
MLAMRPSLDASHRGSGYLCEVPLGVVEYPAKKDGEKMKIVFGDSCEKTLFSELTDGDVFTDESEDVCIKASSGNGGGNANCLCFTMMNDEEIDGCVIYRQDADEEVILYPDAQLVLGLPQKKTVKK